MEAEAGSVTENGNSIKTKITIEHWKQLSADERDYFVFRSLQTIQADIGALKKRKVLNPVYAVFGGFVGGFTCLAAKARWWG